MPEPSLLRAVVFAALAGFLYLPAVLTLGPLLGHQHTSAAYALFLVVLHPLATVGLRRGWKAAGVAAVLASAAGASCLSSAPGRAHVALMATTVVAIVRSTLLAPSRPAVAFVRETLLAGFALAPALLLFDAGVVDTAFALSWFWLVQGAAHHWPELAATAEPPEARPVAADPHEDFDALLARVNERLERLEGASRSGPSGLE